MLASSSPHDNKTTSQRQAPWVKPQSHPAPSKALAPAPLQSDTNYATSLKKINKYLILKVPENPRFNTKQKLTESTKIKLKNLTY